VAILEKYIWIKLHPNTNVYFEKLGYDIPKYIDKHNILRVKRGTKILVKVEDLRNKSNVKVTKVCDDCGIHSLNQPYSAITKSRADGDGKDRCFNCGTIRGGMTQKNNLSYENSLEYYALNSNKEILLEEFCCKNKKKPNEVSYGSNEIYLWNCSKCESKFSMSINARTYLKYNCPYCAGQKVNYTNCLNTTYPVVAKEWHPTKNGKLTPNDVTKSSNKKAWWQCVECNNDWNAIINSRTSGKGCPFCSKSKGEKRIRKWLEENNTPFESQKEFDGLTGLGRRNLSFDFYLPKQNILIEYQGQFHDGSNGLHTSVNLKKQKEHDKRKREYAKLHNIKLLEIWYWDLNKIESKLKKELNQ
jgi:hypothetical protein